MFFKDKEELIPAIVQEVNSGQVLMLGYMNKESYEKTIETKKVTFFSRSRNKLWQKGETSGNYLTYIDSSIDCDQDTLLVLAQPEGPTCHLGTTSCFKKDLKPKNYFLSELEKIISQRKEQQDSSSYTQYLFRKGTDKIAQKVGEEGVEVCIAAVKKDKKEVVEESADLLFHLMVLLNDSGTQLNEVLECLEKRNK